MTDVRGARLTQLLNDPAIGGDLLLVGIAMVGAFDFHNTTSVTRTYTLDVVAAQLWPQLSPGLRLRKVQAAFRSDARTYRPPSAQSWCTAPMVRRDGTCRQHATIHGHLTDWDTGEQTPVSACHRHCTWYRQTCQANRAAKPPHPPLPCANHGGELRRHFPELDWPWIWRSVDPRWTEHPEKAAWPRPTLRLIVGDDIADGAHRPLLASVSGVVS